MGRAEKQPTGVPQALVYEGRGLSNLQVTMLGEPAPIFSTLKYFRKISDLFLTDGRTDFRRSVCPFFEQRTAIRRRTHQ
jgi:hypothetical protein